MTSPQSKPEGQSLLDKQVWPQKLRVCPSVTNERQRADTPVPQLPDAPAPQASQSIRPGRVAQVPVPTLQN
jgi:hypothetical protein